MEKPVRIEPRKLDRELIDFLIESYLPRPTVVLVMV